MSTVTEIVEAVRRLNESEKNEFLDKLRDLEFQDAWDRKMSADAQAGKLDFLVREADEAMENGRLREGPGESKR